MHRDDKTADLMTDCVLSGSETLNLSMYESKEFVTKRKNLYNSTLGSADLFYPLAAQITNG